MPDRAAGLALAGQRQHRRHFLTGVVTAMRAAIGTPYKAAIAVWRHGRAEVVGPGLIADDLAKVL